MSRFVSSSSFLRASIAASREVLGILGCHASKALFANLFLVSLAVAQVNLPANQSGSPINTSSVQHGVDSVNTMGLGLHIEIPLLTLQERGRTFTWKYVYNSPSYTMTFIPEPTQSDRTAGEWGIFGAGELYHNPGPDNWKLVTPYSWWLTYDTNMYATDGSLLSCVVGDGAGSMTETYENLTNFRLMDPEGTPHPLAMQGTEYLSTPTPGAYEPCPGALENSFYSPTMDGGGEYVDTTSSGQAFWLKDGTKFSLNKAQNGSWSPPAVIKIEDSNGNLVSSDMMNRAGLTSSGNGSTTTYTYKDSGGNPQNIVISFTDVGYQTSDCDLNSFSNTSDRPCYEGSGDFTMPSSISLPKGLSYQFTYNQITGSQVGHGELTSMTLPTGANIQYTYQRIFSRGTMSGRGGTGFVKMGVNTRTETVGGTSSVWTYTDSAPVGPGLFYTVTVADPNNNCVDHVYGLVGNSPVEGSVISYQGCGSGKTVLQTVNTTYTYDQFTPPGGTTGNFNIRPAQVQTVLNGTLTKMVQTDYQTFTWGPNGTAIGTRMNPKEIREYDFGASTPTRTTDFTYLTDTGSTSVSASQYQSLNIAGKIRAKSVYAGSSSGTLLSTTSFDYDNYGSGIASSGAVQRDAGYGNWGNATSQTVTDAVSGTSYTSQYTYEDTGNLMSATDFNGNKTSYSYTDAWGNSSCGLTSGQGHIYLTSVTNPKLQTTYYQYNSCTGTLASIEDANTQTSTFTYDMFGRTLSVSYPSPGGGISFSYNDSPSTLSMTATQTLSSSTAKVSKTLYDGLGRVTQTQLTSDPYGTDLVNIGYDGTGQVISRSTPFRSVQGVPDSTYGVTSYGYDGLGRKTLQTTSSDNGIESWAYSTNAVTFTDEAGNQWKRTSDGLGRLTQVMEPNGTSKSPSMETDYVYDALGNLTSVQQWGGSNGTSGARSRNFTYDNFSRLIQSFNPESGWICYGRTAGGAAPNGVNCSGKYDGNGNLSAKTDARGVVTSYLYDSLNRLLSKSYSGTTPSSCFQYDVAAATGTATNLIGRLTGEWTQSGPCPSSQVTQIPAAALTAEVFMQYDSMGRLGLEEYCSPQSCNYSTKVQALYDLAGNMTSLTYPDGRNVGQTFDQAGHLSLVTYAKQGTTTVGTPYETVMGYDAAGHPVTAMMGNGVVASASYDPKLQIANLAYSNTAGMMWGKSYSWAANGNLQFAADVVAGKTRQYAYDSLNRLKLAQDIAGVETSTGQVFDDPNGSQVDVLQNSQALGSAGWSAQNATISPNSITGPDGSLTAGSVVASSGSDTWVADFAPNPAFYDGLPLTGTVWLKTPSSTPLTTNIYLVGATNTGPGNTPQNNYVGPIPVTLTQAWQKFQVSGTLPNGLINLGVQIGGVNTITAGHEVDVWGLQMQVNTPQTAVTNYIPYSQQIGGIDWNGYCALNTSNMTMNSSVVAAPDGTHTATGYVMPSTAYNCSAGGDYGAFTSVSGGLTTGATYTSSVWLRGAAGGESVIFGLNDCATTTVTLTTAWQRYSLTNSAISSSVANCGTGARGFELLGGTAGSTYYVWGAQTEFASSAGQYVATLNTPVTVDSGSTNLLPSSEQFNGQGWTVYNGAVVANTTAVVAPDGTSTADSITSGTTAGAFQVTVPNPALYDNATVTASVYLCVPSGTTLNGLKMYIADSYSGGNTGVVQTVNLTSTWQRFQVTATNLNGLSQLVFQIGASSTLPAGQTVYAWGAEMVVGSSAGPPVETAGTTTNVLNGSTDYLAANGLNETYAYDAFGNMTSAGNFGFAQSYGTNNRLNGSWSYDADGNSLNDSFNNTYTYDAEDRISTVAGTTYTYDAEGRRVSKSGSGTVDHIYFGGREISRLSGTAWTDLIYGSRGLLAEASLAGNTTYRMMDHLGTQVGTLSSTGALSDTTDYAPFGQVFAGGSTDPYKFTGKERDAESGNDYFGARYYASTMGRFLSPDWSAKATPVPYAKLDNPQSLNLYSYVLNNPVTGIDPDGHVCIFGHGSTCNPWKKTIDRVPKGQRVNIVLNGITGLHFHPSLPSGAFNGLVSGVTSSNTVQVKNGHVWPGFFGGVTGLPSASQVSTAEKAMDYAFSTGHEVATIGYSNGAAAQGELARDALAQGKSFSYSLSVEPNASLSSLTDISNASTVSQTVRATNDPVLNTVGILSSASSADVRSLTSSESFMTNTGTHNWLANTNAAIGINGGPLGPAQ